MIYRTWDEHANHYTTDAVVNKIYPSKDLITTTNELKFYSELLKWVIDCCLMQVSNLSAMP
jgi:hypothetical protein